VVHVESVCDGIVVVCVGGDGGGIGGSGVG
jgi:hypothetical protein